MKTFKDSRLPKGITIFLNDFDEYVAVEFNKVAQFENNNIRASRTLEGAINNYLNNNTQVGSFIN